MVLSEFAFLPQSISWYNYLCNGVILAYTHPDISPQIDTVFLENLFTMLFGENKTDGFFMEMGAFNGWNWSPTAPLALLGWSGIYIEPQKGFFYQCVERWQGHTNIKVFNHCVGSYNGEIKLFINGSTSTTKDDVRLIYNELAVTVPGWSGQATADNYNICQIKTLDTIIAENNVKQIDVIVIDVEGAEIDVLNGFSFNIHKPKVMIIETHEEFEEKRLAAKAPIIESMLTEYKKVYANYVNTIYVHKECLNG